jgi:hypothetical protein
MHKAITSRTPTKWNKPVTGDLCMKTKMKHKILWCNSQSQIWFRHSSK